MRDLRGYGPVSSGRKIELEEKAPPSPWPSRILCIVAAVLMVLNIIATRVLGDRLFVHFWPYVLLEILPILLLVAALYVFINQRLKNRTASKIMMFVGIGIGVFALSFLISMVEIMSQFAGVPVAYYSSPEKTHRLVIMRSMESETDFAYSVYPMTSKYFYNADAEQRLSTNSGVDLVEWESEDVALVHMIDREEQEVVFTVDFNNPVSNTRQEETPAEAEEGAE